MYKAVNDKHFWMCLIWMLIWLYCMIFTANPSNCLYYEGKIYEISKDAFIINTKIEPSKKNSEWRRVFHFTHSDFRSIHKHIKVGDSFQLYYTKPRKGDLKIFQMYVNEHKVVKYNWFKWHWYKLILFLGGFFILFIFPEIKKRMDAKHPVEIKLKKYKQYTLHYEKTIVFPKWIDEYGGSIEYLLYEYNGYRYLQMFVDRLDFGVYKFDINEITPENASQIADDIYRGKNYTDRKYQANIYDEMDSNIS